MEAEWYFGTICTDYMWRSENLCCEGLLTPFYALRKRLPDLRVVDQSTAR